MIARDEDAVALRLLDPAGRTVHQGQLLSEGDRLLAGLAPTVQAGASGGGPRSTAPEVPAAWEQGDQLAQLDAVLVDGGMARRSAFHRYRGGA
ncbi:hypothetical protein [Streptomyces sp. MBT53]|nr:hypothetical protein [Streptomyces sp. MBT53]MBK6012347.1 hypothetical protein [Streptomyces sp. MBT53]